MGFGVTRPGFELQHSQQKSFVILETNITLKINYTSNFFKKFCDLGHTLNVLKAYFYLLLKKKKKRREIIVGLPHSIVVVV